MIIRNYLLPIALLCIFACTAPKQRYQIVLTPADKEVPGSQIDSSLPVLNKRMAKVDESAVVISFNDNKKNIVIETTCNDKDFLGNTLLQEGKLEFYECYTIAELADLLTKADQQISTMMRAGTLPRDSSIKTYDESENPLFRVMGPARPYRSPSGAEMYPAYLAQILEKDFDKMKSYLPVLYQHLPVGCKLLFKKAEYRKIKSFELYMVKNDDTKFTASGRTKKIMTDFSADGKPVLTMEFDGIGANTWLRMTQKNTGKYIAIVMDDELLSVPIVNGPIEGGRTEIAGGFTMEEAEKMADLISTSHLPVKLKLVSLKALPAK
jgi:SecD/SecF fusion protein